VTFLSAVPGVVLFSMMRGWLEHPGDNAEAEATALTPYTQIAARLAADVLPDIVQKGLQTYLWLTLVGLGLMIIAFVGTLIAGIRKRGKPSAGD